MRRKTTKIENDFKKDIPEYSDDRIREILKLRDHYQPEAAKMAIDEAIKRGIIFSEQDLFAEEYMVKELESSIFPSIKKEDNRTKIRRSIARSLAVCGAIPTAFGILQMYQGKSIEGVLILLFGLIWLYCAVDLIKNYNKMFVYVILLESIIALVYVSTKLILTQHMVYFDYFVPVVLFLLIVYGLFFMKRIAESK